MTGFSSVSGSSDNGTIKYSQPVVGLNPFQAAFQTNLNYHKTTQTRFNPTTVISYNLPVSSFVSLKIYDFIGNEVVTLVNDRKEAGRYFIEWNASDFSSGIYFYKLITDGLVETKKMNLIK